jgi:hypothetical protein
MPGEGEIDARTKAAFSGADETMGATVEGEGGPALPVVTTDAQSRLAPSAIPMRNLACRLLRRIRSSPSNKPQAVYPAEASLG